MCTRLMERITTAIALIFVHQGMCAIPRGCPAGPVSALFSPFDVTFVSLYHLYVQSPGAQYRLVTTIPAGCDPSNCDYYLGIRTNDEDPQFLDFMMVGKAQGWIAVGFSPKQEMVDPFGPTCTITFLMSLCQPDADVLACAVNPDTSQVVVMDTYNVPDDHNNIRDTIQVIFHLYLVSTKKILGLRLFIQHMNLWS